MNGPEQVPDNSTHSPSDFESFQSYHPQDKSNNFEYCDSTQENIGKGQEFSYGSNNLPEKE